MTIRRIAVALGIAVGACSGAASAAEDLIVALPNRASFANPGPLLREVAADRANARIEIVAARADLINERGASVRLNLPGGIAVDAVRTGYQRMASGNEVWSARIVPGRPAVAAGRGRTALDENADHMIAVRSGGTVLANIRIAGELYRLVPIDDGAHALIEVDQSLFLADEDGQAYTKMLAQAPSLDTWESIARPKAISTIRVMVAFGRSAARAIGNEQQATDLAFAEANGALAATNTDAVFVQAGPIQYFTQSESTNYSTMLARLTNLSDGYYDAIGTQRDSNTADIVAYVAPRSATLCGQAAGIATSNANAYFVMNPDCLSGNWTFVHEAGHVVGARHDNDPTTTPFSYGHGYVMTSINRRTVMAVNNGPCSTCTRYGAFSSPNYTLSGVPIGTASFNDNTRVWQVRGPTVAAFR
jgi:hypothetical protein